MVPRIVLVVCLVCFGWSAAKAQQSVYRVLLPTLILPAAPPPRLETLVLQRADLPTSYSPGQSGYVDNEGEAASYPDPQAALEAFKTQERETGYSVAFSSQAFATTGALAVSDKVARYSTATGALAGQEFMRGVEIGLGYEQFTVTELFEHTIGLRRLIPDPTNANGKLVQYMIVVQRGRYVAAIQVLGRESALDADEALVFAQKAAARLTDGPQPAH